LRFLSGEKLFALGLPTRDEALEGLSARLVPDEELIGGPCPIASVELFYQSGFGESADADVEGQRHERVELVLAQRHLDGSADARLESLEVAREDFIAFRSGDL
jgi:hypothetical protein